MNWFGPLWEVAVRLSDIGVWFLNTADNIRPVPIVGGALADFFDTIGNIFGWCAFYLGEANWRIESLRLDTFLRSVNEWLMEIGGAYNWEKEFFGPRLRAWLLYRIGFTPLEAVYYENDIIGLVRLKVVEWFDYLEPILEDPFGWIREKIIERVPALGYLFEDPERWVLYMLGVPWEETVYWERHLFAYLLYSLGLDKIDALNFESNPVYFIRWKVLERWDFLDDLLLDPTSWLWDKFKQAVDRYIDVNIDWLVGTVARVLNTIWQTRI